MSPQQVAGHLTVLNPQGQKFSELVLGKGESLKLADNPFFPHQWGVSSSLFSSGVAALEDLSEAHHAVSAAVCLLPSHPLLTAVPAADCGTVLLTTPRGGCCPNRGRKRSGCSVSGIALSWESQVLLIPLRKEGGEGEKKMLILTFFNLLLSIYGEGLLCGAACFYCFIAPLCPGVNK